MHVPSFRFALRCGGLFVAGFAFLAVAAFAQPTLTAPATSNLGAGQVTLALKSSAAGTGYFTLLEGSAPKLGTGAQTKAGKDGNGAAAARFGSLKLAANTTGVYTVDNLKAGTPYTVCFTADNGAALQGMAATARFTTGAVANPAGALWTAVGGAGFSVARADYIRMALAPDGSPWVAYDDSSQEGKLTVMRFDGTAWVGVGSAGFSAAAIDQAIRLAFAPDGAPHVAYVDNKNTARVSVKRFDGSSWIPVGSEAATGDRSMGLNLGFFPDGSPYLVCQSLGTVSSISLFRYDGAQWREAEGFGAAHGFGVAHNYPVLAMGPDGTPFVGYQDGATFGAGVVRYDGTAWVQVGDAVFSPGTISDGNSLAIAPDGTPYFSYTDLSDDGRASVKRYDGAKWVSVGARGFSGNVTMTTSMAIAPDGVPHVAFNAWRGWNGTVMKFSSGAWLNEGPPAFTAAAAVLPQLALTPDGLPCLVFQDEASGYKVTVMKFAPPQTYAGWVQANFTAADQGKPKVSGATADPDGAGLPNLLRFAHDLPARGPVAAPVAAVTVIENGARYAALRFPRRSSAPGLSYVVQASSDLVTWTTVSSWKAGATTVVTARDSVALGAGPRRFLRLQVTLP
ncbi:MAG: hypothetical protein IPL39_20800 [Opitutaceae bacterium]|nr:hypothetical protein [Opitutaceae bacterium]